MKTVYTNGQFITMTNEEISWLCVEDDKIIGMGNDSSLPAYEKLIDLKGKTLLPGFINSHIHPLPTGMSEKSITIYECETIEDVIEKIDRELKNYPNDSSFVMVEGFIPFIMKFDIVKDLKLLDSISNGRPMAIKYATGHGIILNTIAMDKIGETECIAMSEEAMSKVQNLFSNDSIKNFMKLSSNLCVRAGITSMNALICHDVYDNRDVAYWIAEELGEKQLDVRVFNFMQTTDMEWVDNCGMNRFGGCIALDGTPIERSAAYTEDYAGEPGYKGELYFSNDELYRIVSRAYEKNYQCTFHAVGDAAIHQLIDCHAKVAKKYGKSNCRHRIEHVDLVDEEHLELAKELGLIFSVQPSILYLFGEGLDNIVGKERFSKLNNYRKYLDFGIKLIGGTDSPVTPVDILLSIHAAVNGNSKLTVEEALRMFTIDAAYGIHMENNLGSLAIGKCADFVVLDKNPFTHKDIIKDINIVSTYVNGRLVYNQ